MKPSSLFIGSLGLVLTECSAANTSTKDDFAFATQIVVPPCAEKGSLVDLLKARPDLTPRKPSLDVKHYLLDLRVQASNIQELWLLVNHETFPSGVNEVTKDSDGNWWFTGNDIVDARWLGRTVDATVTGVHVGSAGLVPVILGTIAIEGKTPQEWVRLGGFGDHRTTTNRKMVRAEIGVVCAVWLDLRRGEGREDKWRVEPPLD